MYIEDIVDSLKSFYLNAIEKNIPSIYSLPANLIIGGMNKKHEEGIYAITVRDTVFNEKYVPMILYPPADSDIETCGIILGKNMKMYGENFAKNTIKEISDISIWVNDKLDLWVYDKTSKIGNIV